MRKSFLTIGMFLAVFFVAGLCSTVQAQDVERGLVYFKMGGNSSIASSPLDAKFNLGLGGAFRPLAKVPAVFVEPSLTLNMPKRERVSFESYPLQVSTKTMILDFNGTYMVSKKRLSSYVTGGVGLLRNSASLTDGYSVYNIGADNHFTKNVGAGVRFFLKERFFVGGEAKNYWAKDSNFKVYSGTVGLAF